MNPRHPWPPADLPPPPSFPHRRLLGHGRCLVLLLHNATPTDRIATAHELLAGTGITLTPERPPT